MDHWSSHARAAMHILEEASYKTWNGTKRIGTKQKEKIVKSVDSGAVRWPDATQLEARRPDHDCRQTSDLFS